MICDSNKGGCMKYLKVLVCVILFFLPSLALAVDTSPAPPPATMVNINRLGPERIGNLSPVPIPPSNPLTSQKVLLGKQLYFDTRLSNDNTISCATCHSPSLGWSDAGPTSSGINKQLGGRRSPPVSNAAYYPLQFWDGRAPSLEEQAKGPIENPVEMGNTHLVMLRTVQDIPGYVDEFRHAFGESTLTIDQVADAIASFERTVVTTDSPFDRYVKGDVNALTPLEKKGLEIFNGKGHCTACHWGGHLSDGRFHNLGAKQTGPLKEDNGRYDVTKDPQDKGKFKTPTIRDVALRAPYLHSGSEKTLEDVVEFYNQGGGKGVPNLDPMMVPLGLSKAEVKAVVAFMTRAMTSLNPEVADVKPIPPSDLPK
jgi:cytochrome c peroxidase